MKRKKNTLLNKIINYKSVIILFFFLSVYGQLFSQNEITVVTFDNPSPGYLFLQSIYLDYIGFVDNSGEAVYTKKLNKTESAITVELQPNNRISYYSNDKFYIMDFDFNILDSFACKNGFETDFHDFKLTTGGHAFLLGIRHDTVDMSIVVPGGKPDAVLLSAVIQEQDESKNVVWEWQSKDHFQINDATDDIDLTWQQIAWVHTNWIEIDNDGNVIISNRNLDEITKINKQTGEIIWRLGGKECKNNQFTFLNDSVNGFWGFSHQHSVHRLPNGNILLYDNGNMKPNPTSRAVEYEIDEVNKTIRKVWEYRRFPEVFSMAQGSVQRLPNGNTLIGWGSNFQQMTFTEISPDGSRAMEVMNFESYLTMRYPIKMASKLLMVQNSGIYLLSDSGNSTGITVVINNLIGSGFVSAERHYYIPHNISYEESPPVKIYGHRWVLNNKGISQFSGKIIFKLSEIDSLDSPGKNKIYWRKQEGNGKFAELETTYNSAQGTLEANISSFGEYIIGEAQVYQTPIQISPPDSSKKNQTTLDIIWHKVKDADAYKLQLSENKNFTDKIADTLINADTIYTVRVLENNKTYYWQVKSVYGPNESDWSDPWTFTTILSTPGLINPAKGETEFPVNGELIWEQVEGATYYRINISKTSEFEQSDVDETGITGTSFRTVVLEFKTLYNWRVKAMNFDNESIWSDTNTFTTSEKRALEIPVLIYPPNDTTEIPVKGSLRWNPVNEARSYNIEIALNPDFETNLKLETGLDSVIYNYDSLDYNTAYYWRVSAENQDDTSSWSDTWKFTTGKYNLVNHNYEDLNLRVETNLLNQLLFKFNLVYSNKVALAVYDYLGNKIASIGNRIFDSGEQEIIIDSKQFLSGIYFFTFITGKYYIQGKFSCID